MARFESWWGQVKIIIMPFIPEHGGKYYFKSQILYDFSVNINPLGYPKGLKKRVFENFEIINEYPPAYAENFLKNFSNLNSVPVSNIIAGNGSIQLIYAIPNALKIKNAIIIVPNFSEYEKALKINNSNILYFFLKEEENFCLNLNEFLSFLNKNRNYDAVFICNPSNPCGTIIKNEELQEIVKFLKKKDKLLVLDEAFIDFTDEKSLITYDFQNLIILQSFTKNFAIPGLRLGICKADKKIISKIKKLIPPWSINNFSIVVGNFLIQKKDFLKKTKKFVKKERLFLSEKLQKILDLKVFNSYANYLLVKILNNSTVFELQEFLLKNKILIRNCANFTGLNEKFFRIAIKKRDENLILIKYLEKFFRGEK